MVLNLRFSPKIIILIIIMVLFNFTKTYDTHETLCVDYSSNFLIKLISHFSSSSHTMWVTHCCDKRQSSVIFGNLRRSQHFVTNPNRPTLIASSFLTEMQSADTWIWVRFSVRLAFDERERYSQNKETLRQVRFKLPKKKAHQLASTWAAGHSIGLPSFDSPSGLPSIRQHQSSAHHRESLVPYRQPFD